MIKVIIADDEQKVCQLIYELIHWEDFGMSVAGMAHNGPEALDLIRKENPDLVITDIKMPGCDGLELIRSAKALREDVDFIIISGYRFFEYAQSAIKYGVSDYLLKPIKKEELANTLKKMQEKHQYRQEHLMEEEELRKQMRESRERVRENFLREYLRGRRGAEPSGSIRDINERYCMDFREGRFSVFAVKIDYDYREHYEKGIGLIFTKAIDIIRRSLESACFDLECCVDENCIWCALNYEADREETVRKKRKDAFSQIAVQKSVFPQFSFTCGIGVRVDHIEELGASFRTADAAKEERLVKGTGRILEDVKEQAIRNENMRLLEDALKNIRAHVMCLDRAGMTNELRELEKRLSGKIGGRELRLSVRQICSSYVAYMKENRYQGPHVERFCDEFQEKSSSCDSLHNLFSCLIDEMGACTDQAAKEKRQEGTKPIRTAKDYILKNYMKPLTLEDMGRITGFNASYFSLLFKKETGKNFLEYLSEVRMEKARELLKETDQSVMTICESVGYSDIKHFTKNFKRETGLKPSEYRKLYS